MTMACPPSTYISAPYVQRFAAVDFGSGSIKMTVADVDTRSYRVKGSPVLEKYRDIDLRSGISNNRLTPEVQKQALEILKEFVEQTNAISEGPTRFVGVATAIFREAENSQSVLERFTKETGIQFRAIPQLEEASLGLRTAQALFPKIDPSELIAWENGSGSFQIAIEGLQQLDKVKTFQTRLHLSEELSEVLEQYAALYSRSNALCLQICSRHQTSPSGG